MAPLIPKPSVILLALWPVLVSASDSTCTATDPTPIPGEFAPQGLDTRTFSKTVRAGDDFYNYANEGWIQSTDIPAGHWDYGQTTALITKVEEQIRSAIAASVARPSPRASAGQQVGDAYSSFLDIDRIERTGSKALEKDIERILISQAPTDVVRWMAHRAYRLYLADHPCAGRTSLDGLSGEQRFFLSWAQAWRYKAPESAIRWIIDHGYHVPAPYRVNGVVRNLDEWYQAFGVQATDSLYVSPEQRVRIW